jgi:hypothetical protein
LSNSSGVQEVSLTCHFPSALASAPRRRRRRRPRRRGQAACAGATTRTSSPPIISSRPEHPSPIPTVPEPSPHKSPPTPSPPPAKRTRKAVKRRCEVELLRGDGVEDDVYVSPPPLTPPPARSPPPPSPTPTPTASPVAELAHFLTDPPAATDYTSSWHPRPLRPSSGSERHLLAADPP